MLFGVGIEICGRNISQFLNVVKNSIDWCVNIKSHMFSHILTMGKYLRCCFSIVIKEILENDADGLLGVVGIATTQVSDLV